MWVDAVDLKDTSVTGCHRTVKHLLGSLARIEIEIEIEIWFYFTGYVRYYATSGPPPKGGQPLASIRP